jgi:cell wall-associated NlpC family hydrolase
MPDPLGVDTSLDPAGSGVEGVDQADFDTRIPVASWDQFKTFNQEGTTAPGGWSASMAGSDAGGGTRSAVVKYAKQFLGMQYKWGGSSPSTSFDCSGFTKYVLGHFGIQLPRISAQQARYGAKTGLANLQAGDLVAWDNSSRNNGADHIALYMGNGQIMEFSRPGRPSRIRKLGKNEGAWGVHIDYKG